MTEKRVPESTSRRKLVRALGIGGAAMAAKALPEKWTKPAVDSVLIPAHAQASPDTTPDSPMTINCGGATSSPDIDGERPDIIISFDGQSSSCMTSLFDDAPIPLPADAIIGIDSDQDNTTWDDLGSGANWSRSSEGDDNSSGPVVLMATRTAAPNMGAQFQVQFDVSLAGIPPTMTVSGITITPL